MTDHPLLKLQSELAGECAPSTTRDACRKLYANADTSQQLVGKPDASFTPAPLERRVASQRFLLSALTSCGMC